MIHIERPERPRPTISMAPLVDCVFLLLIFFLLTSTFSQREAVRIHLPAMSTSSPLDKSGTIITVERDGTVALSGREVALGALESFLRAARQEDDRALIVADRDVALSKVTDVLDTARRAGMTRVAIATRKRAQGAEKAGPKR